MDPLITYTGVATAAGTILGFLGTWGWNRYWQKKDSGESSMSAALKSQGERLVGVETKISTLDVRITSKFDAIDQRDGDRQKVIGRIEGEINRIDGKVEGLQTFWRSKFDKLDEKIDQKFDTVRAELRADQTSHETRMGTMLEAHRKGVHDRLNEATAAQAEMINKLIDELVDRVADPKEK